jgi:hypothetical protein
VDKNNTNDNNANDAAADSKMEDAAKVDEPPADDSAPMDTTADTGAIAPGSLNADEETARRKRLARLSGGASGMNVDAPDASAAAAASAASAASATAAVPASPAPAPPAAAKPPVAGKSAEQGTTATEPVSQSAEPVSAVAVAKVAPTADELFASWADALLRRVFHVTLTADTQGGDSQQQQSQVDPSGAYQASWGAPFLLAALSDCGRLTIDDAESVLLERLQEPFPRGESPFTYMYTCYERCTAERSRVRVGLFGTDREALLARRSAAIDQLSSSIVGYAYITMTEPDMFPPPVAARSYPEVIVQRMHAAAQPNGDGVGVEALINDLVAHVGASPEDAARVFFPVLQYLTGVEAAKTSLVAPSLVGVLNCAAALLRHPVIAGIVAERIEMPFSTPQHPIMVPADPQQAKDRLTGRTIEHNTLVGPLLGPSCLEEATTAIADALFPDVTEGSVHQRDLLTSIQAARQALDFVSTSGHTLLRALLKASKPAVLAFLGRTLRVNAKRTQSFLQPIDRMNLSSPGLMVNVAHILLRFCEPFMDPDSKYAANIDPWFCLSAHRIDLGSETRFAVSSEEMDTWVDRANLDRCSA